MIKATVEEESPETQKYVKHVLAEFVRHAPLSKGKKIEIKVIEHTPPFPEIAEETTYYKAGKLMIPDADYERERREVRTAAFIAYHTKRFKGLFSFLNPSEVVGNVLRGTLKFAVVNPDKIYEMAKELGVKIPQEVHADGQDAEAPATFTENPPEVHWRGAVVSIPPNSKQFCVCRVMFSKAPGETVSWDEIAEEIDGDKGVTNKSNWRSIYDAVNLINQKIDAVCGEKLFESTRQSFRRRG